MDTMLHSQVAQNVAGFRGMICVFHNRKKVYSTGLAQDYPMNDQILVGGPKEFYI